MKKVILALAAVAMVATASAQEKKMWVGGTLGIGNSTRSDEDLTGAGILSSVTGEGKVSTFALAIQPELGYRFNEKWAVGIGLGFTSSSSKLKEPAILNLTRIGAALGLGVAGDDLAYHFNGSENIGINVYTIAPFARFTFANVGKVKFFVDGVVSYSHSEVKFENFTATTTVLEQQVNAMLKDKHVNLWEIYVKPGIQFDLTPSFSLITKIGALGWSHKHVCGEKQNADKFGLSVSTENITFGALFNF